MYNKIKNNDNPRKSGEVTFHWILFRELRFNPYQPVIEGLYNY